ncbi:MAG: prepilin-type N-terminal cleavage/methylation domain-containing protein [Lysobacteraceae bacterium]|jgi:general secretion pathway protein I|nr:prepilin-type N-terminal cleavage/methylation domain-containing protein [Xanthomonadaceae bacterium]MCZ8318662.1 prepilin-type N-terminal cleavage/methylation domain-containing protein [Silanimonas sp.]
MKRAAGFTLLEVLLAVALLGGASVLLLGLLSNGLRDTAAAERGNEAALHARSLLDNLGRMERLRPGTRSGVIDGGRYRWTLDVRPVVDPWPAPPTRTPVAPGAGVDLNAPTEPVLYRAVLTVRWGDGESPGQLEVQTLRALYALPEDR